MVLEVTAVQGERVRTRVLAGGPVSDHKGLNLPGVRVACTASATTQVIIAAG